MRLNNAGKLFFGRRFHIETEAAPQERRRELSFLITGQHDEGEGMAMHMSLFDSHFGRAIASIVDINKSLVLRDTYQFGNIKLSLFEDMQQVIRQVDVTFIDLINQQHAWPRRSKQCGAQRAKTYILPDIGRRLISSGVFPVSGILQTTDSIVRVESIRQGCAGGD